MDLKNLRQNPANFSHNQNCVDVSMSKTGRAASSNAADLAARAQLSDCAPSVTTNIRETYAAGQKGNGTAARAEYKAGHNDSGSRRAGNNARGASRKKWLKICGAGSLALIMGASVLCGVLLSPMSGSAASSMTSQDNPATNLSAEAQAKAELDANILAGGDLGLDPENDPVVWVTDNGFEIKSHDVAVSSGTTTVSSTSWKYVTLGSYNWIIIGYSTNEVNQSVSGHVNINNTSYNDYFSITNTTNLANKLGTDSSPAGSTIKSECVAKNDRIYFSSAVSVPTKLKSVFNNAVGAGEIPAGCVLCLCAGITGTNIYGSSTYFPDSNLDVAMTTVYNNIKSAAGNAIQSTKLTSLQNSGGTYTSYTHTEHLFPLAQKISGQEQTFCVETYLDTNAKRNIGAMWWLRSFGGMALLVLENGTFASTPTTNKDVGVRPAFVLKLY